MTQHKTAMAAATALTTLPAIAQASIYSQDPSAKVLAFHHVYDVPMGGFGNTDRQFTHMDNERVAFRLSLHIEEFKELLEKGFGIKCDMTFYVQSDRPSRGDWRTSDIKDALDQSDAVAGGFAKCRNGKEVMDALGDVNYVDTGFAIEMGYDPRPVLDEIHAGNLTKLGEDGKPIINGVTVGYRDGEAGFDPTARSGKVLKGPNYVEPNIPAALGWE